MASPPFTFSRLVLRPKGGVGIAFDEGGARVVILETLRRWGYNAVGAEHVVFGKDRSDEAERVLGGTVREIECLRKRDRLQACRVAIVWELLDRERDAVVYEALTWHVERGIAQLGEDVVARRMLRGALGSLTRRERFRAFLRERTHRDPSPAAALPLVDFRRCPGHAAPLPEGAARAAQGTVVVETPSGFGSGFFISPDGLLLTADHSLGGTTLEVRLPSGSKRTGQVLRRSSSTDVALVRVSLPETSDSSSTAQGPCLPLDTALPAIASDLYAVGSPAGKDLASSVTRGVMSGLRETHGLSLLQTDAAVSPGSSGGPLMSADGRVVGVVSRKLVDRAVEGIGFAVPVGVALTSLALREADSTDERLTATTEAQPALRRSPVQVFLDSPDLRPSLDPAGDRRRAEAARERRLKELTPAFVPIMRIGGLALAAVGVAGIATSSSDFDPDRSTRAEFEDARLTNDLGWGAAVAGTSLFALSWLFVPEPPSETPSTPRNTKPGPRSGAATRLRVGLAGPIQVRAVLEY